MKIMVAAASFSSEISGIQRHAFNLVRCLLLRPEISKIDLVVAPWQRKLVEAAGIDPDDRLTTHVAEMEESSLSRNRWYYRELPVLAAQMQTDLVHLTYPVPVDAESFKCPTLVTLHDLYPYEIPQNFGFPKVMVNRLILRQCLRSVNAIACVSESTKLQLRQYSSHSTWTKATRIYNCVAQEGHRATTSRPHGWQDELFLLSVSQHRRNKNIVLLIEAFDRLLRRAEVDQAMKLVVVGITGPETPRILQSISRLGLEGRVRLLHGLSESELQWCYTSCQALVAPSITEGFGLPVAEALLVGCRVVCSDIAAFREVGGTHCSFVRLGVGEEEALANAIRRAIAKPLPHPVRFPHLSLEVLANEYQHAYQQLLTLGMLQNEMERSASIFALPSNYVRIEANESRCVAEQEG